MWGITFEHGERGGVPWSEASNKSMGLKSEDWRASHQSARQCGGGEGEGITFEREGSMRMGDINSLQRFLFTFLPSRVSR